MSTLAINNPPGSLTESARHLCRVLASYSPAELRHRLGINPPQAPDSDSRTETDQQPNEGTHVR